MDWRIAEDASVTEAVRRMVANDIGILAVTRKGSARREVVGVFSERDFISKVAVLGRDAENITVNEVCTLNRLITVNPADHIDR